MTEKLDIIVRLNNGAKAGLASINNDLEKVGKTGSKVQKSMGGLYKQLLSFAATLGTGLFAKNIISTFASFDDNMRAAGAVTNATKQEMEEMTKAARVMGETTRYTAADAAQALRYLGMAGFDASASLESLPGVLNLAAAGNLELASATDIATNILSAYGLEADRLGRVNDVLVKTFTNSNATLIDIGESFKLIGPIVRGVGGNFEDLLASIGKLATAGLRGTISATALRGAIDTLFNPTKEEAKLMEGLKDRLGGVSLQIKDSEGDFIGFGQIIKQLEKAGVKGDEALRLFGLRAGPGMEALLGIGSDALLDFQRRLSNTHQDAERVAEEMEAGIGGAIREAKSAFESIKIAIGDAFSEDAIDAIREVRDIFLSFVTSVEEAKIEGTFKAYGDAIQGFYDIAKPIFLFVKASLEDMVRASQAYAFAIVGDMKAAREAFWETGKSIQNLLADYDLMESWEKERTRVIDAQIKALEKQIATEKKVIEQNEKDINGWRAKIAGAKVYEEQIKKHQANITKLQEKITDLSQEKYEIKLEVIKQEQFDRLRELPKLIDDVKKEILAENKALSELMDRPGGETKFAKEIKEHKAKLEEFRQKAIELEKEKITIKLTLKADGKDISKELEKEYEKIAKAYKDSSAIGKSVKDVKDKVDDALVPDVPKIETKLKIAMVQLGSVMDTEFATIEAKYNQGLIKLGDYFDQRALLIQERVETEIALLKYEAEQEDDVDKVAIINAKIFQKEQELNTALIDLENERYDEEKQLNDKRIADVESLNALRLRKEKALKDQMERIQISAVPGEQAEAMQEIANLQERHNRELKMIQDFYDKRIEIIKESGEEESKIKEELAKIDLERQLAIQKQFELQQQEQTKITDEQQLKIVQARLETYGEMASSMSQIIADAYELMGKENKEMFEIMKDAALAEAIINIAQGITKAIATGGVLGIAQGAIVGAAGAIQIAKIERMEYGKYALGGLIPGSSPTKKSDDKIVSVTSGEYIHPVDSVQHYGLGIMEAIRQKQIPRALLSNFSIPALTRDNIAFAAGGLVTKATTPGYQINVPVTVNGGGSNMDQFTRILPQEIEKTVQRLLREYT